MLEDIVMANFLAMKSNVNNLLVNLGTGKSITILELARNIFKNFKFTIKTNI